MNRNERSEKKSANPDPITRQPGSHPVGTGVGAAAGGAAGIGAAAAAGAAAGTAAGPIGTGIGAAAGAVVGGLAGKAAAEHVNPSELDRYLDYTVVDRDNNKIGTIDAVWEDHTGQPAYVAIKTGWLGMGKTHVVPAQSLQVSDATRKIRLPYTVDHVKNAPSFERQSEIDEAAETRISTYYRQYGLETEPSGAACATGGMPGTTEKTAMRNTEEEVRIPLAKEEVRIGKREVEAGGVRLRKIIRTETVNQPVELKREEIVVERVPAKDRSPTRTDVAFREEEIYVPLRREEAVIEKTTRATEEVRVGKKQTTERRDVSETVRREDVDIQRQGSAKTDLPGTKSPRR
jgi:uncharacterized protein (TIGR02271 family)